MNNIMSKVALLFLPIVLLPSAFSFECDVLNGEAYAACLAVKALPIEEKDLLYAALLHPEPYIPMHNIIYAYNTAILVKEKPQGTPFKDGKYIKGAWVKILAVMPSVWEENKTFVPANSAVRSAYGYVLDIPSSPASGDCRTQYSVVKDDATRSVLVAGKGQGEGEMIFINLARDSTIESRLSVSIELLVKHYSLQRDCRRCPRRCTYSWFEKAIENLEVTDFMQVYHYSKELSTSLKPLYKIQGSTTATLQTNANTEITFPFSSLSEYHITYDVFFYLKHHDFAQIRARSFNHTRINNLLHSNKILTVKESNPCTITTWNHFYRTMNACDLSTARELPSRSITNGYSTTLLLFFLLLIAIYPISRFLHHRR